LISLSFNLPSQTALVFQFSLSPFSLAALDLVEWIFTRFGKFPTISHTQTLNPNPPPQSNPCISRNEQSRSLKKCEVGDNFKERDGWMIFVFVAGQPIYYFWFRAVNFANGKDVSLRLTVPHDTTYQNFKSWATRHTWLS
jgi:hypothetical protein